MKSYLVRVTQSVERQMLEQAKFIASDKPIAGSNWLERVSDAISDLEYFPRRHSISEEESAAEGVEIRKLVFGNYFFFYHVLEEERAVEVIRFRHAARLPELF